MAHSAARLSDVMKSAIKLLLVLVLSLVLGALFGFPLRTYAAPASAETPHSVRVENGKVSA
jgi:hypothetical protein